jgi:hypothetical protein
MRYDDVSIRYVNQMVEDIENNINFSMYTTEEGKKAALQEVEIAYQHLRKANELTDVDNPVEIQRDPDVIIQNLLNLVKSDYSRFGDEVYLEKFECREAEAYLKEMDSVKKQGV